ncbi:hypothetical protein D3C87_1921400 [compost metagenome]
MKVGSPEKMYMNVDEARCNVKPFGIHDLRGQCRIDVFSDEGDLAVITSRCAFYRYVHDCVDVVFGIDNMPAFDHDAVLLVLRPGGLAQ